MFLGNQGCGRVAKTVEVKALIEGLIQSPGQFTLRLHSGGLG